MTGADSTVDHAQYTVEVRLIRFSVALLLSLTLTTAFAKTGEAFKPDPVKVRFVHSVFSDFLFYLFYGSDGSIPGLPPLPSETARLNKLVALPERSASVQVRAYSELYKMIEPYKSATSPVDPQGFVLGFSSSLPPYDQLRHLLDAGQALFPEFQRVWQSKIEPVEKEQEKAWNDQWNQLNPLGRLQALERIRFRHSRYDVGCIVLHLAGSSIADLPGSYSQPFPKPNLPWFLGHEATHLLIGIGSKTPLSASPRAKEAVELLSTNKARLYDVEESLCLLMQVKLAQACGTLRATYRLGPTLVKDSIAQRLVSAFEENWDVFVANPSKWTDIRDFGLDISIATLRKFKT